MESSDFPRGGAEHDRSAVSVVRATRAEDDVLFGKKALRKPLKPKIAKSKSGNAKERNDGNLLDSGPSVSVGPLSLKKLCAGFQLLGCVWEIHKHEMLVSLPNGLMGYVPLVNVNETINSIIKEALEQDKDTELVDLSSLFHIGGYVPVTVSKLHTDKHGYKKIELSTNPEHVNEGIEQAHLFKSMVLWGYVRSIEDHGAIISFGSKRFQGFCPSEKIGQLIEGSCDWFMVEKIKANQKVLGVSVCKDMSPESALEKKVERSFVSLRPGQLANCTVTKVVDKGLLVSVSGHFTAIVDQLHLPNNGCDADQVNVGDKIVCRLIYIQPNEKLIGVTLLSNVVHFNETSKQCIEIGSICDCKIEKVDSRLGLLAALDDGDARGYCHISRISDDRVTKISKMHKSGTSHRCRVLGYNGIDLLHQISLQKSVLDQPYMRYHDLHAGLAVKGHVATLGDFGMIVKLGDHLKGLCPTLHLSDIVLKHPEKKFVEGKKVNCRVLEVLPDEKRLVLTHKKTLTTSTHPLITSHDDISIGLITHGFIKNITDSGIVVGFYNRIKGFAHISKLGLQPGEKPAGVFYMGQVVLCKVIKHDKLQNNLKLSLLLSSDVTSHQKENDTENTLRPGTIVSGKVTQHREDMLTVTHSEDEQLQCSLPVASLSDFRSLQNDLYKYYSETPLPQQIDNTIVMGTKKSKCILSRRYCQILASQEGRFVSDFAALKTGLIVVGSVTHVMDYGLFVELACGLVGLAPISYLTEQFISDPHQYFKVGQSVLAKVIEIDSGKHRFLLTLVHSELQRSANDDVLVRTLSTFKLVEAYLEERQRIATLTAASDELLSAGIASIGKTVKCKVQSVSDAGLCIMTKKVPGFIPSAIGEVDGVAVGDKLICYVIDFDVSSRRFVGTNCCSIVNGLKTDKDTLEIGEEISVEVKHITDAYIVTIAADRGHSLVLLAAKQNLNDVRDVNRRYVIGQVTTVTVASVSKWGAIACETTNARAQTAPLVGSTVAVEIKSVKQLQLNVSLCSSPKIHGRVHIAEIEDDIVEGQSPFGDRRPGQVINAKLIGFRDIKSHKMLPITHKHPSRALLDFSTRPSVVKNADYQPSNEASAYNVGDRVNCYVKSLSRLFVWVVVNANTTGRIHLCHLSQDKEVLINFKNHFKVGTVHKTLVIGNDDDHNCLELSCIGDPSCFDKVDQIVCGRISKVVPNNGLLIELPSHTCGFAHVTQLSDEYAEAPLKSYAVDQIVRCCVIGRQNDDRLELSLRGSRVSKDEPRDAIKDPEVTSFDDIKKGSVVRGYVKSASDAGVFVSLGSKIVGRAQIKDLSKYFVKNWKPLFPVGKLITAMVKTLDASTNHIALSFRGSDTGKPDLAPPPKRASSTLRTDGEPQAKRKRKHKTSTSSVDASEGESDHAHQDAAMATSEDDEESDASENEYEKDEEMDTSEAPRLELSASFDWHDGYDKTNGKQNDKEASSSDSDDDDGQATKAASKKTKRQKRAAKKEEEDQLHKAEMALLDEAQGPQSAADFDRILLGSPNSSLLWIQYMAFHLHSAEADKARAVAQKALKTISFREEQEKLNVWVAWLNLECTYGTRDSVQSAFRDAVQQNDAKTIYMRMATIYSRAKKTDMAEQTYAAMAKKFGGSKKVWISYAYFLMSDGKQTMARSLMDRALKSLPQRKHVELIVKFAMLEFKFGEQQRGVTMFESVIKNYPRRTDLWSIYIDAMIKTKEHEQVRNIFERATALTLSLKKVKFIFKRYLDFERKFGNETTIAHVKERATNYAENSRSAP